jgi:hypothetical protein
MRTTMDIPDELYRSLKARAAMEGRTVREVAVSLFREWVGQEGESEPTAAHAPAPLAPPAPPAAGREEWLNRWQALGEEMKRQDADPRSAVRILLDDRR